MPISLPFPIQSRCISLINLGRMMNLFSINMFMHVMDVYNRLMSNELWIYDLQDLQRLCDEIVKNEAINNYLREDIKELFQILDLFIKVSYTPVRPCGLWSQ